MKTCTILRAVPGAGKSTFAEYLCKEGGKICCADDYFLVDGEYKFDAGKIGKAHDWCKKEFKTAIYSGCDNIVVANTNTQLWEFKYYKEEAEKAGYKVFVVIVENYHGNSNIHGCPDDKVEIMKKRLMDSIKL